MGMPVSFQSAYESLLLWQSVCTVRKDLCQNVTFKIRYRVVYFVKVSSYSKCFFENAFCYCLCGV